MEVEAQRDQVTHLRSPRIERGWMDLIPDGRLRPEQRLYPGKETGKSQLRASTASQAVGRAGAKVLGQDRACRAGGGAGGGGQSARGCDARAESVTRGEGREGTGLTPLSPLDPRVAGDYGPSRASQTGGFLGGRARVCLGPRYDQRPGHKGTQTTGRGKHWGPAHSNTSNSKRTTNLHERKS